MSDFDFDLKSLRKEKLIEGRLRELEGLLEEARKLIAEKAVYFNADQMHGDGADLIRRINIVLLQRNTK